MNRPALEALRATWNHRRQAWTRDHGVDRLEAAHAWLDLLDALLAPDPAMSATTYYFQSEQQAMWHRMALDQHLAGLANWSA